MFSRRKALTLLGLAPVAGPKVAKEVVRQMQHGAQLARLNAAMQAAEDAAKLSGIPAFGGITGYQDAPTIPGDENNLRQYAHIFANRLLRRELQTLLYEDERMVTRIDPDLATKRSFSLSAKIAFQRQRNVERRMQELQTSHTWQRVSNFLHNNRLIDAVKSMMVGTFGNSPR